MTEEQLRSGPISPQEVNGLKEELIPNVVFDTFNQLISREIDSLGKAVVYQDVVVKMLEESGLNRNEIYRRKWLDVEPCYRDAGWDVTYDRPVYWGGEDFRAHFIFSKPE